ASVRPPPLPTLLPYTTLFRSSSSSVPACDADREIGKRLRLNELHDTASWVDSAPVVLQPRTRVHRVVGQPRHAHVRARLERVRRSEEHTSELQSRFDLVCRLL